MVELGREFFSMSALADMTVYDPESMAATLEMFLGNEAIGVLVIERDGQIIGAAATVLAPLFFNAKHRMAHEVFWFVSAEHRGSVESFRLFEALEAWAFDREATVMMMTALSPNGGTVERLYLRRGYRVQETNYIKAMRR